MMSDSRGSLIVRLRWWELTLSIAIFFSLFSFSVNNIPSIDDDGVEKVQDVVVSWSCSRMGKSEYQLLIGVSGKSYVMGGSKNACKKSGGKEFYVGKELTVFYAKDKEEPIQIDVEGGGGFKAEVKASNVFAAFAVYGFPIFMILWIVAKKRRGDYSH